MAASGSAELYLLVLVAGAVVFVLAFSARVTAARSRSAAERHISMSGLKSARIFHVMFGWLCLTQNLPSVTGTWITDVRLSLQQGWKPSG